MKTVSVSAVSKLPAHHLECREQITQILKNWIVSASCVSRTNLSIKIAPEIRTNESPLAKVLDLNDALVMGGVSNQCHRHVKTCRHWLKVEEV